jgi:hypothetical protein
MKLSIAAKFNLVFVSIFAVGFLAAGVVADRLLKQSAREETLQNARLLLEAAKSVRGYTAAQIAPLLTNQMKFEFHPQSVPSYSAVESLNAVLKSYPDFSYKEATLNPTNLRDKASDWEVDVVQKLRGTADMKEFVGERDTAIGRSLYIARPLQIKDPVCLGCHTTAAEAPKTMVDIYGPNNGFGWKLNEIVGAQVISVPMTVPLARANQIFKTFMLSLLGVFWWCSWPERDGPPVRHAPHQAPGRRGRRGQHGQVRRPGIRGQWQGRDQRPGPLLQPHAHQPGQRPEDARRVGMK